MENLVPQSSPVQPFGAQSFWERSSLDSLRYSAAEAEARAALQRQITMEGTENLRPEIVRTVLMQCGIAESAARELLLGLWEEALKTLIFNDSRLDAAESAYLIHLQTCFGLTDDEVRPIRDAAVRREFLRIADTMLSEDPTNPETLSQLDQEARNLRLDSAETRVLLKEPARKALGSTLVPIFIARRLPEDEANQIATFVEKYGLIFEGDEQNKFLRCWHLWQMDKGILPDQKVDIALGDGEQCGFGAYSHLFETRKTRRSGISMDSLERIDSGPLYITTRRIVFVGAVASKTIELRALARAFNENGYLVVQKISGRNQRFMFTNDLDQEAAIRVIGLVRIGARPQAQGAGKDIEDAENKLPQRPASPSSRSQTTERSTGSPSVDSLLRELDNLIGLSPVKQEVRSLVNYLRVQRLRVEQGLPVGQVTMHLVFTGNPGTGKTTVARLLAKIYQAMGFLPRGHLVETDRSGLVGGYLGQTALKTAEVISKALGGVLFIDEAYALARGTKEGDSYGTEAIDTLLKAMEDHRDELVVIVAGYQEPMQNFLNSNPGLRSRFTRYVDFPDYLPDELLRIFETLAKNSGYRLSDSARSRAIAVFNNAYQDRATTFGNGRLARTLFERGCIRLADRLEHDTDISRDDLTTFQEDDIQM